MKNIRTLALSSVFMAMIMLLTMYGMIPIAWGYLNLGDALIMLLATILPASQIFLIGAFGSAFADIFLGYSQYALFTFFIKGLEGVFVALLYHRFSNNLKKTIPFIIAALWIGFGYGVVDAILYQEVGVGVASFGINLVQGSVSAILAIAMVSVVTPKLSKLYKKYATYE